MGNYRGQIKAADRVGCYAGNFSGLRAHWNKCRSLKKPLEVACVIGVPPNISYAAVARIAPELDEFAVAGAIAGTPVELIRCKTVDLLVPAQGEIVIEGVIPTDESEWEGPFGEVPGYMAHEGLGFFVNINCITMRRDPIYVAFLSQFPPARAARFAASEPKAWCANGYWRRGSITSSMSRYSRAAVAGDTWLSRSKNAQMRTSTRSSAH